MQVTNQVKARPCTDTYPKSDIPITILKGLLRLVCSIVRPLLLLSYAFTSSRCTALHRSAIYGVFVYVFIPFDLIHDMAPRFGYVDDTLLVLAALSSLYCCIDLPIRIKVKQQCVNLMSKLP